MLQNRTVLANPSPGVRDCEYSSMFVMIRRNKKGFGAVREPWKQGKASAWDGGGSRRRHPRLWVTEGYNRVGMGMQCQQDRTSNPRQ